MSAGKVIIVTGASRGIGRGIATVLSRDCGHTVYATARSESSLRALADEIGPSLIPCAVDHSDDASVQALVERVEKEQGRIDALVNNAYGGVGPIADHLGKKFWEKPLSVWDASHDVGLRSHYIAAALVVPVMLRSGGGGLIANVSSAGGHGYLFDVAYGVGKQALDRMSCDMATELQGTGVRAVTIWPGAVNTESTTFPGAESVEFTGKAIAALLAAEATDASYLDTINGKILQTAELSAKFGFDDTLGGQGSSANATESAAAKRKVLSSSAPVHWRLDAALPALSSPSWAAAGFEAGKTSVEKVPGQFAKPSPVTDDGA